MTNGKLGVERILFIGSVTCGKEVLCGKEVCFGARHLAPSSLHEVSLSILWLDTIFSLLGLGFCLLQNIGQNTRPTLPWPKMQGSK